MLVMYLNGVWNSGDINLGVLSVYMVFKASSLDDPAKGNE